VVYRYYDPATEQFISVDPLVSQTGQPFSYAGDDPANASDPSGQDEIEFDPGEDILGGGGSGEMGIQEARLAEEHGGANQIADEGLEPKVPCQTPWGWTGQQGWFDAVNVADSPGDHLALIVHENPEGSRDAMNWVA
jgi:uncharacterized protein RhaS with RHS repeats